MVGVRSRGGERYYRADHDYRKIKRRRYKWLSKRIHEQAAGGWLYEPETQDYVKEITMRNGGKLPPD